LNPEYLKFAMPSLGAVGQSSILLIFAFEGIEVALMPIGEVKDPARTVPRSILGALGLTTIIYLAIQSIAQGLLGPELSVYADAPLAEAARRLLGPFGKALVLAGGTVSMFGYVSGDMLGTPRALFALGRDRALPSVLARVHPRYRTPAIAIVIYGVIVAALSISSSFNQLAVLANVSGLLLYGLCVAASYELQRRDVRMAGVPFDLPGGVAIQTAALLGIGWLVAQATRREFVIEAGVLVAASAYYLIRRSWR
jgi:APA family basic amino acid/polyamine antiporter